METTGLCKIIFVDHLILPQGRIVPFLLSLSG